jgi:hypothetical protein
VLMITQVANSLDGMMMALAIHQYSMRYGCCLPAAAI